MALADDLPLNRRDGGFVRPGHEPALDEARALQQDLRRFIAALQARYAAETGCRALRIKHNHMLGYFVEVPAAVGEAFLRGPQKDVFVHRQTMADAMRFSTVELGELQARIASAADRALKIELAIFDALVAARARCRGADRRRRRGARGDRCRGGARRACRAGELDPAEVDRSLAFRVEGGRHPVVEAALKRDGVPFIPNDCDLGPGAGGRRAASR